MPVLLGNTPQTTKKKRKNSIIKKKPCICKHTGNFMKKVLPATWALRDRLIVLIELVYTESTFYMKPAVCNHVCLPLGERQKKSYFKNTYRQTLT